MTKRSKLLITTATILTVPTTPSVAQDAPYLEEIIVNARKRDESILKVPVIQSVLTHEQIEQFQTDDLYAVAQRVPGLVIGGAFNGAQVGIRGVTTSTVSSVIDQSIALNVDGLQVTQGLAYAAGFFDVTQVEVLKGPQALFYGKNSPGGVISLRSADPTDDFELVARVGYEFEANEQLGELIVSGPLSRSLKARLAVRYTDMDGFFENEAVAVPGFGGLDPEYRDFAPSENLILRGTVLVEPGDIYTARIKATYAHEDTVGDGYGGQLTYCPEGIGSTFGIPFINPGEDCEIDRVVRIPDFDPAAWPGIRNNGIPFRDTEQLFGSIEQNLLLGPAMTLTSVTGLYDVDQSYLYSASPTSGLSTLAADTDYRQRDFTQELRLVSDFTDSPINFMAGIYYHDGSQENDNTLRLNTALGLPPFLGSALHEIDIRSESVFGQVIWSATPEVEITAGARWTEEERTHKQFNLLAPDPNEQTPLLDPVLRSDNLSPEVTVAYTPTDNLTFFAAYKEGFKSGSFNAGLLLAPDEEASFGDENVSGFEGGIKARLLQQSMNLNIAGYYYEYEDLQVGATELASDGTILSRTLNAASAEIYGIDFDVSYRPRQIEGLNLFVAANYNHARYDSFENAPCGNGQLSSEGCDQLFGPNPPPLPPSFHAQDLSGEPLVRAPDWVVNFGVDYEMPVGGDMTLALGFNANYSSSYFNNLINHPEFKQDSYVKVNANFALRGPGNRWELALIGNNIGNELTSSTCFNSNATNGVFFGGGQLQGAPTGGPDGQDEAYCFIDRGRELWLRGTYRF